MQTTIQQWGNSLALRIPKEFARQTKVKKGRLLVTPMATPEISLESLLAQVTPQNIHPETDWGKPKGKKIW